MGILVFLGPPNFCHCHKLPYAISDWLVWLIWPLIGMQGVELLGSSDDNLLPCTLAGPCYLKKEEFNFTILTSGSPVSS